MSKRKCGYNVFKECKFLVYKCLDHWLTFFCDLTKDKSILDTALKLNDTAQLDPISKGLQTSNYLILACIQHLLVWLVGRSYQESKLYLSKSIWMVFIAS